ncbi:3-methyladenine DNA glycosylase [Georgenia sp. SYP-B2076]|uniref:3-methyladenine DNA glycosylase n=1 Tax=Georgenia sp. SYP-B2076 TaxID=2495881 RepID=UPI000F8E637C|nr:3-methyladenine DNA glycosylase [Georgenia sp. SYP-B2076]
MSARVEPCRAPVPRDAWVAAAAAHAARADDLTAGRRARASQHAKDPVEDFLFDYYSLRPAQLRRWHPGAGVALAAAPSDGGGRGGAAEDVQVEDRAAWRWHHEVDVAGVRAVTLDTVAFMADRGDGVRWIHGLLQRTASRTPHLGCLGLHEWAMVYRQEAHRHPLPLRLGQAGTDAVVEAHPIRCSHFDAFRFFTTPARPLNRLRPSRGTQQAMEQPGCLHANMDLLRHALKLGPACPGALLLDCFVLARDIRVLDMRASPYDLSALGRAPVRIETGAGRAEYIAAQRGFSERAEPLRERLLAATSALVGSSPI